MERLENTLRSNASMELRLQQLDIKKDILRNKMPTPHTVLAALSTEW